MGIKTGESVNRSFDYFEKEINAKETTDWKDCDDATNGKIVDAFITNDLEKILKLHKSKMGLVWYKHLNKGALNKVNPIQSNIMGEILETKVDLLWGGLKIDETKNSFINTKMVLDVERAVQKYGEVVVRLSYVDGELKSKIFNSNFDYDKDNFGNFTYIQTSELYTFGEHTYTLKQTEADGILYTRLYKDDQELTLSSVEEFKHLQEETILKHKMHFLFTNERNLTQIINPVNTIDMNLSNIDYTTFRGRPFMLLREDMASRQAKNGDAASLDDENIEYQLMDSMDFVVKNSFMNKDDTLPMEMYTPQIAIDKFQAAVDYLVGVCANTMGLSVISLGSNIVSVSASSSADTLREKEKMTLRTKISERNQRISQFNEMSVNVFGNEITFDINDDEEFIDPALLQVYLQVRKDVGLSRDFILKEIKPSWTEVDLAQEEEKYNREKSLGFVDQIIDKTKRF